MSLIKSLAAMAHRRTASIAGALLLMVALPARADLTVLDNDALQDVSGQSGADMSFVMQLNQDASTGAFSCASLKNCRLGVSFNNRDVTARSGGVATTTGAGYRTWLVFKGLQGYLNFQYIALDGADISYLNDSSVTTYKAAIQLTFDPTKPVLIRNFGFSGLALQTDTVINEGASNVPGYLAMETGTGVAAQGDTTRDDYASGVYTKAGTFDTGRETAFMGLTMNGNLALSGTVKIFGCNAGHPRC